MYLHLCRCICIYTAIAVDVDRYLHSIPVERANPPLQSLQTPSANNGPGAAVAVRCTSGPALARRGRATSAGELRAPIDGQAEGDCSSLSWPELASSTMADNHPEARPQQQCIDTYVVSSVLRQPTAPQENNGKRSLNKSRISLISRASRPLITEPKV